MCLLISVTLSLPNSFSLFLCLSHSVCPFLSFFFRNEQIFLTVSSAFDRVLNPHLMIGVENLPQAIVIDFTNVRLIDLTGTYIYSIYSSYSCNIFDFYLIDDFYLFLYRILLHIFLLIFH